MNIAITTTAKKTTRRARCSRRSAFRSSTEEKRNAKRRHSRVRNQKRTEDRGKVQGERAALFEVLHGHCAPPKRRRKSRATSCRGCRAMPRRCACANRCARRPAAARRVPQVRPRRNKLRDLALKGEGARA
jgi:hypothetical protein